MKNVLLASLALLVFLGLWLGRGGRAEAAVELRPTQLYFLADRGQTLSRLIQVYSTEDVAELTPQPSDLLYERQADTISARAISVVQQGVSTIGNQKLVTFKLEIRLQGVPAGEYTGDVSFMYRGGEIKLPMKIMVRHSWPAPLVVLLIGVAAGVGLSAYRARGRPRDQVLVRVGLVRAFVQRDAVLAQGILPSDGPGEMGAPLPNPFRTRIEAALTDVEMSLHEERFEEARGKMDQADALLRKWVSGQLAWTEQLSYLVRLQERMNAKPGSGRFLLSVRSAITDLIANSPTQDTPQTLRDAAQKIADRIEDYEQAEKRLAALESLRAKLAPDKDPQWLLRTTSLRARLEGVRPDEKMIADLACEIENAIKELSTSIEQAATLTVTEAALGTLRAAAVEGQPEPGLPPVPEAHLEALFADTPVGAKSRLQWFLYASYAVALLLLGGAGFNEVYSKKQTFGADLWADYFALLIWGFGAEATRDSVTTTLRGWGVSLDGKPPPGGP